MSEVRDHKEKQFARTLARGIELLRAFGPASEFMSNGDLAAATALDRATVARLTYTLVKTGFLEHDRRMRKYRLSPGVLRVGYPLLASLHLRQIARPLMQSLASTIRGTVGLGTRHHTDMVYLDAVINFDELDPPIDRGMSTPLLASAMGNAWLAFADPVERQQALNIIRIRKPELYTRYARRADEAVAMLRDKGYCISIGHRLPDRLSVATPWRSRLHDQIFVFNCTVSTHESLASPDAVAADLGSRLVAMVHTLENASGAQATLGSRASERTVSRRPAERKS